MSKLNSLIELINSLSKSEKKKVSLTFNVDNNESDYVYLFKLIEKEQITDSNTIKKLFEKKNPSSAINITTSYLLDTLLDVLSSIRSNQDSFFRLFNLIMRAKVLYEKSLYYECFSLLSKIQDEAVLYENFSLLLIAQKIELDYLLSLGFPYLSEQELLTKQYKVGDTMKKIRKLNEHTFLFELLKHRILYNSNSNIIEKRREFNDLVISEMSIVSGSGFENFEIEKNHKLFQANYFMNMGDYKSALNSFFELNNTFEKNTHLLSNPPIYYLGTIEGVLESLHTTRNYEGMRYFLEKLEKLETSSVHFKIQILNIVFIYTVSPLIDKGKFSEAKLLIDNFKEDLFDKSNFLVPYRFCQLATYTAIIYIGTKDYSKARKTIGRVLNKEYSIYSASLIKIARLLKLIILREQNDIDYIDTEIRLIKKECKKSEKTYMIETLMLKLINKPLDHMLKKDRIILWKKIEIKLIEIYQNKNEQAIVNVFDFGSWLKSKILNVPFETIIQSKNQY